MSEHSVTTLLSDEQKAKLEDCLNALGKTGDFKKKLLQLKEDESFFYALYFKNNATFPYFPKELHSHPKLCALAVMNSASHFKHCSLSLRADRHWVNPLLSFWEFKPHSNERNIVQILSKLPIGYFDESFLKRYRQIIGRYFEHFPAQHRLDRGILQAVLTTQSMFDGISAGYVAKHIPDTELRQAFTSLFEFTDNGYFKRNQQVADILENFHLKKKLDSSLSPATCVVKKKKI